MMSTIKLGRTRRTRAGVVTMAMVLAVGVAGCGDSDDGPSTQESTAGSGSSSGSNSSAALDAAIAMTAEAEKGDYTEAPSEGPAAVAGKDVWLITLGASGGGGGLMLNGAEEASEALGWNTRSCDGAFNQDNGYTTCLNQALAAAPDGIILLGIDCAQVRAPLEQAKSEGILVSAALAFDCDENLPEPAGEPLFVDQIYSEKYPTQTDFWSGLYETASNAIIAATEGKAKSVNLTFDGNTNGLVGEETVQSTFDACEDCELYSKSFGFNDLTSEKIRSIYTSMLLQHPDANASMIIDNFQVTLGLEPTLTDRKDDLYSMTTGSGYVGRVLGNNSVDGIVTYDLQWTAWAAADSLNRAFAGAEQAPQGQGLVLLTTESGVAEDQTDFQVPYDYASAYKEVWSGS